ncbi:ABC transporter permease [Salmonella enterica]|uniref:ABC transporter permease n=1 Tax=Salmonella enterica TaxID=28901 RepID=UPI00041D9B9B|nr:ABC transporter permease [Salmonella enterica]
MQSYHLLKTLLKRCLLAVSTLWLASIIVFTSLSLLPGDAATVRLGGTGTMAQVAQLRTELGLDRPLPVRYINWVTGILHGNWGYSNINGQSVSKLLNERGRYSLLLGTVASLLLFPLSIVLGTYCGLYPGRRFDRIIIFLTLIFVGLPEFITGTLLIIIFSLKLHWLPPLSLISPHISIWSQWEMMIFPVLTILASCIGHNLRMIRSGTISASLSPATINARLNGIPEFIVILRWILPLSLVNAIPIMARYFTWLLGGTLISETIFSWPGLAIPMLNATLMRDTPVVMGISFIVCSLTILINLLADIINISLNPSAKSESIANE